MSSLVTTGCSQVLITREITKLIINRDEIEDEIEDKLKILPYSQSLFLHAL